MPYSNIKPPPRRRFLLPSYPYISAADTGKLCTPPICPRRNRHILPLQPAILADRIRLSTPFYRQFLPTGSFGPAQHRIRPTKPAILADRIRLSNPLHTGNTCRPAIIAAQLRLRTASDRQILPPTLTPGRAATDKTCSCCYALASFIPALGGRTGAVGRACWGGRSFRKPLTVFPEAPARFPSLHKSDYRTYIDHPRAWSFNINTKSLL